MKFLNRMIAALLLTAMLFTVAGCSQNADTPPASVGSTQDSVGVEGGPGDAETLPQSEAEVTTINVTSPHFALSDGFIEPIDQLSAVPDGYIGITSAAEFDKIRANGSGSYILMNDIDLGTLSEYKSFDFTGIFDGNGYTIQFATFYEDKTYTDKMGKSVEGVRLTAPSLFRTVSDGAEIKNLCLAQPPVVEQAGYLWDELNESDNGYFGFTHTLKDSTIRNCYTTGDMKIIVGGGIRGVSCFVGNLQSSRIESCYNESNIEIDQSQEYRESIYKEGYPIYVGMLAIDTYQSAGTTTIQNCFNTGSVTEGLTSVRGISIAGILYSNEEKATLSINHCYNAGNVEFSLAEESRNNVSNKARSISVAGILGNFSKTGPNGSASITNSYNSGNFSVNTECADDKSRSVRLSGIVGGISTPEDMQIANCYNAGDFQIVAGSTTDEAGCFGIAGGAAVISDCYNVGTFSTTAPEVTSLGAICRAAQTLQNCYFIDSAEDATGEGALFPDNQNIKQLTDSQMREQDTFVGFDFSGVWEMGGSDYPYPVLQAQSALE